MFDRLRNRLLINNLGVLVAILTLSGTAVHFIFERSLETRLENELRALAGAVGQTGGRLSELRDVDLDRDDDGALLEITVQWFSPDGRLVDRLGGLTLSLPLTYERSYERQATPPAQVLTLPVQHRGQLLGYVRVGRSLAGIENNLQMLRFGLGSGALASAVLVAAGTLWLTRQAMRPAEQSIERLRQFTADASHELRSPLTAIKSNCAVALKYDQGMRPGDREKLQLISEAAEQLTRLAEDLLVLTRTDGQPNRRTSVPCNLTALVAGCVQRFAFLAEEKSVHLKVEAAADVCVQGGDHDLERLVTNLLENAIQYTPSGGRVHVSVRLSVRRGSPHAELQVQDTGIGIARAHLERVFDRFWRADEARHHRAGGNGLGLAIARAIAEEHGGSISVSSEPGRGSCFRVLLPSER
jgi:signal transduction histidine kinase